MKTATVTWISYHNYGTYLQAFALQQFLVGMGIENTIISDSEIISEISLRQKKENNNSQNNPDSIIKKKTSVLRFFNPASYVKYIIKRYKKIKGKKRREYIRNLYKNTQDKFNHFKYDKLIISPDYNRSQMRKLNDKYDIFICGSDQIWSLLDRNFDTFYFLDFVNIKKISYAASIGSEMIDEGKVGTLKELLSSFSSISVREKQTADQLFEITHRRVEWVADPTLLVGKNFWEREIQNNKIARPNRYLFCYFLETKPWYYEYSQKLANHLKLKILVVPYNYNQFFLKNIKSNPIGPIDFVSLISSADFVLTDSYHGSLFSLIFNKQFLYLKRFADDQKDCQNIRIYSLFDYLDISDSIIPEKPFDIEDLRKIDYSLIDSKIDILKKRSSDYLKKGLFNEKSN